MRYEAAMRVVPNPDKEARNRREHRVDFSRVAEIVSGESVEYPDDRPLGYEHEGRTRLLGLLDNRVVVLVFEPVEVEGGELAVKPISLRRATATERRLFEEGR
jgi:uncharacterized DUF497 family protein